MALSITQVSDVSIRFSMLQWGSLGPHASPLPALFSLPSPWQQEAQTGLFPPLWLLQTGSSIRCIIDTLIIEGPGGGAVIRMQNRSVGCRGILSGSWETQFSWEDSVLDSGPLSVRGQTAKQKTKKKRSLN